MSTYLLVSFLPHTDSPLVLSPVKISVCLPKLQSHDAEPEHRLSAQACHQQQIQPDRMIPIERPFTLPIPKDPASLRPAVSSARKLLVHRYISPAPQSPNLPAARIRGASVPVHLANRSGDTTGHPSLVHNILPTSGDPVASDWTGMGIR